MPLSTAIGAGGPATTNGRTLFRQTMVLAAGAGVTFTRVIEVIGLSTVVFWIEQTVGTGTTVRLQFSIADETGGAAPQPEWLPVQPDIILPDAGGGASRLVFRLPCRAVRIRITPPAAGCTVNLAITASS